MFGLLTKISGLVWGTGENEGTRNVAHAQQHTSLADDNTGTNSNKKPTARLRKDLYGKVTRLYDGAGVIEEDVYFTFDCVIGGIRPQVGTGVHAEAWRETETSGWKATRVQVITEWNLDDENISNTVETFIGSVTNITTDRGVVDEDITFELSCVRAGYTPYQGDWVKLDLERIPDGTVEVKGVMPLREKSFTGTVSSVSSGFGYIDDDVFFSCGVCSRGFRARRGDAVRVTAVESRQGRAVWRAIKVEPKRQSSTLASPSPHSQVFMGGRMAELISDKEGITISDQLDFGNVLLGESKSLDILIRNNSAKAHTLQSCSSIRPSSEFTVHMADDTPAPSRPQDRSSQRQLTTSLKDRSFPVKELEIPPSQAKHVVVVFNPRNLGRINHLLVFNFGGFEIGRYLAANVQDADQAILKPCAPYQRSNNRSRDAWRRFSELTSGSGEECIIPGEKPLRKRKLFLPVKLSLYSIPRDIRRCLLDGRDLGSIVHSLREPLSLKNYAAKFSALLYAEELQMEMDMRQFDMTRVSMNTCGEFLSLQVPGLAEGRPSLLIGDKIVVSLSGSSSNSPKYEGYIHEIRKDDVMLKFCEEFHHRFAMQECDVMFYFNRTTLRRCHRAVEFAVSLGEEVLFPKKLSAKLPVFSLNFRSDLSTSEMKTCAKPGESINHRKNEETFLYNGCLNERQKAAVCRIAGGQCRPTPYLLFGPPGTGKTITVVEAILQVFHGLPSSRVLACAPSNSAADLIAERLHHSSYIQEGDLVRLNAAQRGQHIPEAIACYCKDTDELDVAAYYRIIVSTCSTAGQLYSLGLRAGHFTHVFVDEAGQATEPDCLVAVGLAAGEDGQVVLAGDPFQLGPVLQSAVSLSYGLNVSLLERLMSRPLYCRDEDRFSDHGCYDPLLVTKLVNNYRSHPAVLRLPSAVFYHDELEACAETQMRESQCQWNMLPRKDFPVIFHGLKGEDVREGSSPSWFNPVEAVQVVKYLQSLRSNDKIPLKLTDIGVITPYRKQVEKLRLLLDRLGLNEVKVGSVEEFQGQERLAIIISTVRSNESLVGLDVRHSVGFLSNPKRFNVAITRAQALLVVVGNPHVLCQDPYWCCLLQYCVMNDAYVGCDLPSLDQQFLTDEFKEAMELLSRTITHKNDPSENTNSFTSSEITENKETQEETENPQKNSDTQTDYHEVVHKEIPCSLKGSNLPSRDFVDKSSILGSNQKSKTAVAESKSRIPRGDICDNEESDQVKFKLGQNKQHGNTGNGMLDTGHTGRAVSSDVTTGLEGSYSKTTKTKTLSELQDADSDDELEEFVFKPRNNRE